MKKIIVALSIIVITAILSAQFIYPQDTHKPEKFNKSGIQFLEKLDLTDQQRSRIFELVLAHQKTMVNLVADLKLVELEMAELKSSGNYSREDVLALVKKINDKKLDISIARENHHYDIYEILSPEQREIFDRGIMVAEKFKNNLGKCGHTGFGEFRKRF